MSRAEPDRKRRTRREQNLDATRAHVVQAAATLFFTQGYGRTTIAAIASTAGVAVQTVYNSVGNKATVLASVFESTIRGPQAPRSVPEVMAEKTSQEADARGVIRLLAEWFPEAHARMGPLWRVLEEAAAHDEEAAELATRTSQRRLDNYRMAARALEERGGLGEALDLDDAAALIWAVGHPSVYRALVEERGWSRERYQGWVDRTLGAALGPR